MTQLILGGILMVIGYLAVAASTFVWAGKAIYDFVNLDAGFWAIALTNFGMWALTIVVGLLLLIVGKVLADK